MTDRPIIFSAPMVLALLAGNKIQTRRLATSPLRRCEPGDRLWVRENFVAEELSRPPKRVALDARDRRLSGRTHAEFADDLDGADGLRFLADNEWQRIENTPEAADRWMKAFYYGVGQHDDPKERRGKTVPSIHMPRWASRLTLLVTAARTEPLQSISDRDAIAEGIKVTRASRDGTHPMYRNYGCPEVPDRSARYSYRTLWSSLHGAASWNDNPDVIVLTFEVIPTNIDKLENQ